jgi:hypothetical protein
MQHRRLMVSVSVRIATRDHTPSTSRTWAARTLVVDVTRIDEATAVPSSKPTIPASR